MHVGAAEKDAGKAENATGVSYQAPINCLVYIGLPTNPQFLGPQDPQALAEHIVRSRGPSGENKEYVYMLDQALEQLRVDAGLDADFEVDEHVADVARRVREAEKQLTQGIEN